MQKFFRELDPEDFRDKVVILDLDATLIAEESPEMSPEEASALKAVVAVARQTVIVSNNLRGRAPLLRERFGVEVSTSWHKKPFPSALGDVVLQEGPRVVVGDKFLTDGLFAKNLDATFVYVEPLITKAEPLWLIGFRAFDTLWWRLSEKRILAFIALARPLQWVKNLLVFAPLFFAHAFFSFALVPTIYCFVSFSLLASAGYAFNDASDHEADAKHPTKRRRAIASGIISPGEGRIYAYVLAVLSGVVALLVPAIIPWLLSYLLLSYLYSSYLKRIPYIEMMCVMIFFLIRLVAGGAASAVPLSGWLMLTASVAALFLISGKRYAESRHEVKRVAVSKYPRSFLNLLPAFAGLLVVLSYTLYSFLGSRIPGMPFSSIFVALGVAWYLKGIYGGKGENPELRLWKDPVLLALVLAWGLSVLFILYRMSGFSV